jgi:hypothetical protein
MCCSDDEELIDVLNAEAEIEDLGKRKGTNAARDEIVKRLRQTPPNPNTLQGGFRSIPITGYKPTTGYKTYKIKKDPLVSKAKEVKETMLKPVAVPVN